MRIFSLLLLMISLAFADEKISEIDVIGNNRIEKSAILTKLKINKGEELNSTRLNQALKDLYKTGLFSHVSLNIKDEKLIVKVEENKIIHAVNIEGNNDVRSSIIRKALKIKPDSILNVTDLKSSISEIKNIYKFKGKAGTQIEYQIVKNSPESVDVTIKIREAKAVKIAAIHFHGNQIFSDQDLRTVVRSKTFSIFRILSQSFYFVEEFIEVDKELLKNFYMASGYYDFVVKDVKIVSKRGRAYIDFYITEGALSKFGNIKVESALESIKVADIVKILTIKNGDIFNINVVNGNIRKIVQYLNENGYFFTEITPSYSQSENEVNVLFNIKEAKKIYVNQIDIEGNTRTLDSVIRRKLLFTERDPYNSNKVSISKTRLERLGIFEDVELKSKPVIHSENLVDTDLRVKEKSTGFFNIKGGYNSQDGPFASVEYNEANLLGTGDDLSFSVQKSIKDFETSFSFGKNNIFDTNVLGGISVSYLKINREKESSYKSTSVGFKLSAGYNVTENLTNTIFYSYTQNDIYDVKDSAPDAIKEQKGISNISSVGYAMTYNKLNNIINPTYGYIMRLNQELAGVIGGLNFVRSEFKVSYYHPLIAEDIILNARSRMGYIIGYAGDDIKIGQRFFVNEMRGFDSAGIGPRAIDDKKSDGGSALGGNKYIFNTVQVEFPSGVRDVKGVLFWDNAILTGAKSNSAKFKDSGSFRNSLGFGLIWDSPLGMKVTLDVGFPVTKETYDKTKTLRIGVYKPV